MKKNKKLGSFAEMKHQLNVTHPIKKIERFFDEELVLAGLSH